MSTEPMFTGFVDIFNFPTVKDGIIAYYKTIFHRVISDKLCNEVGNFESRYIYETHDEYVVLHLVSQNNGITFIPDKFYMSRPYNNLKATSCNNSIL